MPRVALTAACVVYCIVLYIHPKVFHKRLSTFESNHNFFLDTSFHISLSQRFLAKGPKLRLNLALAAMHCEYQSLRLVHVYPLAHSVAPVNPVPPHWP